MLSERDLGAWILPAPMPDREWLPIPILLPANFRRNTPPPYGYKKVEGDDDHYHPIPEVLDLLEEAKKHLKKYTYKEVAAWLSKKSGHPINAYHLSHRIKSEQNSRSRAATLRRAIATLETKIKRAQAWEAKIYERYKKPESTVDYLSAEQRPSKSGSED
jgi:hypothetical protein